MKMTGLTGSELFESPTPLGKGLREAFSNYKRIKEIEICIRSDEIPVVHIVEEGISKDLQNIDWSRFFANVKMEKAGSPKSIVLGDMQTGMALVLTLTEEQMHQVDNYANSCIEAAARKQDLAEESSEISATEEDHA